MNDRAATGWLAREFDGRALWAAIRPRWPAILLGLGTLFRAVEYLRDRSLDGREHPVGQHRGPPVLGAAPRTPVRAAAPFGFLVVERLVAGILGSSLLALRLFPLVAGLASMFLFARIRPVVGARSAFVALGLFAFSDSLIYFSAEIKPYIVDVLAAVIGLHLPTAEGLRRAGPRGLFATAALGSALVWFSFPSAFGLAGVGLGWLLAGLRGKPWPLLGRVAAVSIPWLASFGAAHAVARILLTPHSSMWVFWGFAFPPRGPWEAIAWTGRRLLNLFANPMHFDTPLGPRGSAVVGATLAAWGIVAIARADRERLARLLGPIAMALVAAGFQFLPFHGRLLLFTVPALTWLVAEGTADLGERIGGGRWADWLAVALILTPFLIAALHLIEPPAWMHDGQGDLRLNPWL
ncbi:MAG: hypothetical protein U0800_22975 [Isosphaeraceae bacterium]